MKQLLLIALACFVLNGAALGQSRRELAERLREPGHQPTELEIEAQYVPIGEQAPDMNAMIWIGDSAEAFKPSGKLLLLDFWFAGCGYCREMTSALSGLDSDFHGRGLSILGVDPYDWDSTKVQRFWLELHPSYPAIMVTHGSQLDYGLVAYPMLYLLDEKRRVIYRAAGYSPKRIVELREIIESKHSK